ncbi:MAG: hypothetical protein FJ293_11345, partial [Planctomycetes bacterium]|nr:hypothetical protein [Planctomycetota bacterium]
MSGDPDPPPRPRTDRLRRAFLSEVGLDADGGGGRTLGQYLLIAPLGRGSGGTVWRALHRELAHEVAIKLLEPPADGAANGGSPISAARAAEPPSERLERFRREAATAAKLRHPGIVRVHDFGHEGDCWYLVMDLVEGRPLDEWLHAERPALLRRLAVMERVARAVDHAHRAGIVHRDLKPANIVVRADDEPVLVDFGVAKARDAAPLTRDGGVVGTLAFMAPEQLRGQTGEDGRADLYSLGVLLHWIATGQLLFGGMCDPAAALAARTAAPPPPSRVDPTLPRALDVLVRRCLEPDPALRLASCAALADDLGRIARGEPILANATTWQRRAWRSLHSHRIAMALLLAAATVVGGGAWLGGRLLHQAATLDAHAELLAIESALLELSPRLRPLLERAELARYAPTTEPDRRALEERIEAVLSSSGDATGSAEAYRAWSRFLLRPEQAADAFARAKLRHPGNPFVWLLSARRHLRRAADSPAWSPQTPITYDLLVEPLGVPAALHNHPTMRQVIADAREDLEQARRTAAIDDLPGLRWIGILCAGLERWSQGDASGAIGLLEQCTTHGDIDFEATLFLALANCHKKRVDWAVDHARRLCTAHPGIAPAAKLLALCLQVDARDRLDRGESPVAQLEEAARWFTESRNDHVVDRILWAQLEFDLEVARLMAGQIDPTRWAANVATWAAVRDEVTVLPDVSGAAVGAAHARVGAARANLAMFALRGQESLDQLREAMVDHRAAGSLVPDSAWVIAQEVQAELAVRTLEARFAALSADGAFVEPLRRRIGALEALGEARTAADGRALPPNPWASAQAALAEAQLRLCEAALPGRDPIAAAQSLEEAAALAQRARALAPQIATIGKVESDCLVQAAFLRPAPLAALREILRRLPHEQLTGPLDALARWLDPLLQLAGSERCPDRAALLELADETVMRMVRAAPAEPQRLALAVEVALHRRWLEPARALDHVDVALARLTGAPPDPVVNEARALALIALAELGGRDGLDEEECRSQATAALVAAAAATP